MKGFKHQHGRDIADEVRQHRRDRRARTGVSRDGACRPPRSCPREHGLLEARDDDEQPDEHEEQRPVDLAIDLLGLDPAREQQQRAADDRHLGDRLAGEERTTIIASADENRLDDQRPVIAARAARLDGGSRSRSETRDGRSSAMSSDRQDEARQRATGAQCRGERPVGDVREAADDHVLRVAGDRRDAADVGRHRRSPADTAPDRASSALTRSSTSGVMTRQIVSLTRKAENEPATTHDRQQQNERDGGRAPRPSCVTSRKKPDRRRLATTIIMPSSSVIVSKSIAR